MDTKFTERLGAWLQTPSGERDLHAGALLLLQLSGNRILFNNIIRNPARYADHLEYQLQKYYNFRVADLTREQVAAMSAQVDEIAQKRNLVPLQPSVSESAEAQAEVKPRFGKRADHDRLPSEIQALYVENLSTLRRMREVHLRLRTLSLESAPCPDSERYPFLKELIALDKKLKASWKAYDEYPYADEENR